jgi:hypothetical protein
MADDEKKRTGTTEPNANEGGDPDRDKQQHEQGKTPAKPDKG